MAVVLETTLGDITIDLFIQERPRACLNFLKLCKMKYYNFNLFHTVNQGFIAQTGDPTGSRIGGESIWGVMQGPLKRYFEAEDTPRIKHTSIGLISFVGDKNNMVGSQFFITLATDLTYLDAQHCVFGEVTEGFEVLRLLNEAICDSDHRPYQDIRITHTVVLDDPFPDPEGLKMPDGSPEPTAERLQGGRIAPDEEIDETVGKSAEEVAEIVAAQEAKARATILEMIGDIPDAEMAPPENVLFVCKLNPITNDDDLEIIFSRFGKIKSCEVIRDKKSGDSLQYAFVEFADQKSCEDAYFKMDNVLIDDRRIHVDFSQSVAKVKWLGKGRGVTHYNDRGEKQHDDPENDIGNGRYRERKSINVKKSSESPSRQTDKSRNKKYDSSTSRERYKNDYSRNKYSSEYRSSDKYYRHEKPYYDNRNYDNYYVRQQENYSKQSRNAYRNNESRRNRYTEERRRSQSREKEYSRDEKSRYRNEPVEEKENKKKERDIYKSKKYKYEQDSDIRHRNKKENKKKKYSSSSEESSENEQERKLKKAKKDSKKKKSRKVKQESSSDSESDSDSESENEQRSSKKKKHKKYNSSSSDNDIGTRHKKKSKK